MTLRLSFEIELDLFRPPVKARLRKEDQSLPAHQRPIVDTDGEPISTRSALPLQEVG